MTDKESSLRKPQTVDDEALDRSERPGDERPAAQRPTILNDHDDVIDDDEVLIEDDEERLPD